MPNYADGVLHTAKHILPDYMNRAEMRVKPATTLMKYLKNTEFLIPGTEYERAIQAKDSDQQTVEVNTLNKQSISTGSARSHNHTGSINDSRKQTVSFTTYSASFKYSLKGADRNIWSLADQVAAQMRSAAIALHESIETDFLARLNTKKSQVVESTSPRSGSWDASNYIFGIANTEVDFWVQKAKGFMREQYYTGQFDAVVDEYLFQQFERIANQGGGNSQNLTFQVSDVMPGPTTELTLDSGYVGQGYIFPVGSVGVIPWIPRPNRDGFGASGEAGGLFTSVPDPLGSGLTFALHQYQVGADNSSAAGETQDVDFEVELSIDLGAVEADSSTANLSPIFKFGVQS